MAIVRVTQIKSVIGCLPKHRACLKGLGLCKINQTVELEDTPCIRGMINKVHYMVKVEESLGCV
ncbi:50S ribosomal protein L30 [Candidatus Photodesmus blepharus]|uniref:Large ribosomal subunit protein uL30 n=1 Tax=Candidatus Photodesmus blepharonis TaxID=1179155 RepID=A0A084CM58_9GAMM|nr:50S ribosomal protein L30 [Candidatus Photodesmus blepharus]KEY90887.1 50S ribosomal protein L30 [Candidatus Photodesmus blepharus]